MASAAIDTPLPSVGLNVHGPVPVTGEKLTAAVVSTLKFCPVMTICGIPPPGQFGAGTVDPVDIE